jgi:hypothetical protein
MWPFSKRDVRDDDAADPVSELVKSLLVEEYKTVREEIYTAFGNAQAIIRWSLAVFGVTLAAGMVAATNDTVSGPTQTFATTAVLALFGWFVPALVWASAFTWLGEIVRVQRAASYLRGFENAIAALPGATEAFGRRPLHFTTSSIERGPGKRTGQQIASTLGAAGVFFIAAGSSVFLFVIRWSLLTDPWQRWPEIMYLVGCIVINVGGIAACGAVANRIRLLRDAASSER